ncbi:anthranilate phosphoribosyltransferase [[Haemophilus] felis]|uniref:Anthranilate phosphoribosyltransferase n=1 Tax=[Haemophilus] felis TaxID=123822 RepID=A0A1T0BB73_9PAST|nr:anthranilate phosphoribosyltransferase [[Haemophilus] felis]NBI41543.1 anthranilate phosphoribosyltransferase [[Haemophilus] felis]OOS07169.1 anthranilate phosphoribosyltransferase [[Haemophilus] felis]
MQQILSLLFDKQTLTQPQAEQLFQHILQGKLSDELLSAALIALKIRGETPAEICGAVTAAQQQAVAFPAVNYPFADIVGTGGDGANTINISTTAAIVCASMGMKIAKHGNRGVSSRTGSSDLLHALGVNLEMSPTLAKQALDDIGLCFLFAQQYHPGFKHVAPVRQALKTRTLFNLLGPLINPARPTRQLLGVYSKDLLVPYAQTVAGLAHQHSIIVHGSGLDEVALHGRTEVAEVKNGQISYYSLSPQDFGLQPQSLELLRGGDPAKNAQDVTAILQGKGKDAHNHAVAMNVAMVMKLFGQEDLRQNTAQALNHLASGDAFQALTRLTQY